MTIKDLNMLDGEDKEIDIDSLLADNDIRNLDGDVEDIMKHLLSEEDDSTDTGEDKTNDKVDSDNDESKSNDEKDTISKPSDDYDKLDKADLIEHLRKKDKRIKDKDTFIGKRSSEIGDLRKQLAELEQLKNSIVDPSTDEAIENPVETMRKIQENTNKRSQLDGHINSLKTQETIDRNMKILVNTLGDDYDYQNTMAAAVEVLKQDKAPQVFIDNFIKNPGILDTSLTLNILKRAEAELKIAALEKKIEEMGKSKKSITDKFNKAGKKSIADIPSTTGKDGGNIDIDSLTPAQVDAMLKKLG